MTDTRALGALEGETGTPMSRLEFAIRYLGEALLTPDPAGYDACWILAAQMLYNSVDLGFCLRVGADETQDDGVLFDVLDRRAEGRFHDPETELGTKGPWPVPPGSQVADFISDRIEHYVEVLRANLMRAWTAAGNCAHPHLYVRSYDAPGRPIGGALDEQEVWERLAQGLDFMERHYPVSSGRHRPHLASADDFTRFLRWKFTGNGRQTWDLLSDYGALLILQAIPRNALHQATIARDLSKAQAAWDRKQKKAELDSLEHAA